MVKKILRSVFIQRLDLSFDLISKTYNSDRNVYNCINYTESIKINDKKNYIIFRYLR